MRRLLFRTYWWLEKRIAPGNRSSQYEYADVFRAEIRERHDWLDIGCGRRPLPDWMGLQQEEILSQARRKVGFDLDMDSLGDHTAYPDKLLASAYELPFAPRTFDLATANMVVEHVEDPGRMLDEIRSVLRPSGRFTFHTPNRASMLIRLASSAPNGLKRLLARMLENRKAEDVFPTHYCFNRKGDIQQLAEEHGFRVITLRFVNTTALTASLGPLAIPELLWLRLISRPRFENWRTNLVGVLEVESTAIPTSSA
jgi:ubiquinone/menaquinone biosynthesis C-methylase UbiE